MKKRQIAILGSTGSIGTQALEVIEEHADLYEVYCLTANNKVELLAQQARKFHPAAVVIANEARYEALKQLLADQPDIKVYAGAKALDEIVEAEPIDMVLTAMVGFAGLSPTIHAIKARKTICLANKETLVVAGELICQLAQQYRTPILPVDSEHSAIFQSLVGEDGNEIEIRDVNGIEMVCFRVTDREDGAPCIGYVFEDGDWMIEIDFWYATQEAADRTTEIISSIRAN